MLPNALFVILIHLDPVSRTYFFLPHVSVYYLNIHGNVGMVPSQTPILTVNSRTIDTKEVESLLFQP